VRVGKVTNASGKTFNVEVERMFADALAAELATRELLWSDADGPDEIVVSTEVLDYEPGNAAKRWVMPGWGTTVLAVRCGLQEREGGAQLGIVEARRTISFGGLFTMGAFKTIFRPVAADVVQKLAERRKRHEK
jgi:hypothetical protein